MPCFFQNCFYREGDTSTARRGQCDVRNVPQPTDLHNTQKEFAWTSVCSVRLMSDVALCMHVQVGSRQVGGCHVLLPPGPYW